MILENELIVQLESDAKFRRFIEGDGQLLNSEFLKMALVSIFT